MNDDKISTNADTSQSSDVPPVPPQTTTLYTNEVTTPKPKKPLTKILASLVLAVLLIAGVFAYFIYDQSQKNVPTTSQATEQKVRIGISMDTVKELRWQKDIQYLKEYAAKAGAVTSVFVADGDDDLQVSQIQNLITQKVDVLIVVPHNSAAVAPAITEARASGIKVISYDRLILGAPLDFYVSFDNAQVGRNSAQYVLDALPEGKVANIAYVGGSPTDNNATIIRTAALETIDKDIKAGKVKLVFDQATDDWNPDNAYKNLKAYLDKGTVVDGVIAGNDGTAFGAIRALEEKNLAGKVPVTGQDADLPALQRIVDGTQTMTNYKPIRLLAERAIKVAVELGREKQPEVNAKSDNQVFQVNSYLLKPIPVTKTNIMDTVVKDGFMSEKDIYRR